MNGFNRISILLVSYVTYSMDDDSQAAFKRQPHEGENLGEHIVTIPRKQVYGATQARPCETSGCSRLRCTVKASNKTRLFCIREQLRCPAKNPPLLSLADAVDADDFGGTCHEWTGKRCLFTENQPNS